MIMTRDQKINLLYLTRCVVHGREIDPDLLENGPVVFQFIQLLLKEPDKAVIFVDTLSPDQRCDLTKRDLLTEDNMLALHIHHGFNHILLAQWLRGLSYDEITYFKKIAQEHHIRHLDMLMDRAMLSFRMIDGLFIESIRHHIDSLQDLVQTAAESRMSISQFQYLLSQLSPSNDETMPVLKSFEKTHALFQPISSVKQWEMLRIYTMMLDYVDDADSIRNMVAILVHRQWPISGLRTCFRFINTWPRTMIHYMLNNVIETDANTAMAHLNKALPNFEYGMIRKVVRMNGLGLKYEVVWTE